MNVHFNYSFVVPVYQEAEIINQTISNINSLDDSGKAEIIIVDGDPKGSTIREIKNDKIKIIISTKGRGSQLNSGAAIAQGEILIFLHADTRLPNNALAKISAALSDQDFAGGAFQLHIDSPRFIFRVIEKVALWRTRLTQIPFGDQAIFMRKDYYLSIGGFQPIPIMEDVELMARVKKRKGRIVILDDQVHTSSRRWDQEGILSCTLRNWLLQILYLCGAKPEVLVKYYR
jgi:rSAM/selenodomain-associated transferase 2